MTTNKTFRPAALAALAVSLAQPAVAHSGVHGEASLSAAFQHVIHSPYHMVLAAIAIGFAFLMLRLVHLRDRRRQAARHSNSAAAPISDLPL
tara:strand:+ start:1619 stop:1894 length:276 start_codon:yes stop_codon:yes gene_type:complete